MIFNVHIIDSFIYLFNDRIIYRFGLINHIYW